MPSRVAASPAGERLEVLQTVELAGLEESAGRHRRANHHLDDRGREAHDLVHDGAKLVVELLK